MPSYEVFQEIADWKADARFEDSARYFYETDEAERLVSGRRAFVIGRKGTGKTAIAHHIASKIAYNTFSQKLSLKNFPWNTLYELKDNSFRAPNEYITIWKYVIYTYILHLMMDNNNINPELSTQLRSVFQKDASTALAKTIRQWTSAGFNIGLLQKLTVGITGNKTEIKNDMPWTERVEILEDAIKKYIDDANYFVIFDELDEDYKYQSVFMKNGQYIDVITGLFKAIYEVKAIFGTKSGIKPVLFLRDDIYSLIDDPDKTKWRDLAVELRWNAENIKPLIAFRLSRAFDPNCEPMRFPMIWNAIVDKRGIGIGSARAKFLSIYEWMTRRTMYRPRDYILFLQLCGDDCLRGKHEKIFPGVVTGQVPEYSRLLRSEIRDEIHSVIPYIEDIFKILSIMRKPIFSREEFSKNYESMIPNDKSHEKIDADKILMALHYFNVIGNFTRAQKQIFRYRSPDATLNFNETIVIHPGLTNAFQIF